MMRQHHPLHVGELQRVGTARCAVLDNGLRVLELAALDGFLGLPEGAVAAALAARDVGDELAGLQRYAIAQPDGATWDGVASSLLLSLLSTVCYIPPDGESDTDAADAAVLDWIAELGVIGARAIAGEGGDR